jgi:hypothetical protein
MFRRFSLLFAVILLASLSTQAQGLTDKIEVFGGYSYMRVNNPSFNTNGWEISGEYKFANWLGAVADIDGHYGTPSGVSTSIHTFLFGPQVSFPGRISPFAHVLIGGAHANSAGFTDTGFALAIGAGIDAHLIGPVSWRVIQGDYLPTHLFGQTENNARLSTGIVVKF